MYYPHRRADGVLVTKYRGCFFGIGMSEGLSKHDAESEFFVSEAFLIKKALILIQDMNLLIHVAVFRLETLDASFSQ